MAKRQKTTVDKLDFKQDLAHCPPPRHIVSRWRATKDANGDIVAVQPEQWTSFAKLEYCPDPESKALAMRIGIERERGFGAAAIRAALGKENGLHAATFTQLPDCPSLCSIEVNIDADSGRLFGCRRVCLATHTRITVEITQGTFQGCKFKGTVHDALWDSQPSIAALVRVTHGEANVLQGLDQGHFRVAISLDDDGTFTDRQNASMIELGKGLERNRGIDLCNLVLRAPALIQEPDVLFKEIEANGLAVLSLIHI